MSCWWVWTVAMATLKSVHVDIRMDDGYGAVDLRFGEEFGVGCEGGAVDEEDDVLAEPPEDGRVVPDARADGVEDGVVAFAKRSTQ